MTPIGGVVVYNIRANIVHNDRICGYVQRSWPNAEKVKGSSRRSFNPGSSVNVGAPFLGKREARAPRTRNSLFQHSRLSVELDHMKTDDHRLSCYQHDTWVLSHLETSCRSTL